jgi:hypothetical protein
MPRKKKPKSAQAQPASAVFDSVGRIVASLDEAKPHVKDVTKKGSKAAHDLQELEVSQGVLLGTAGSRVVLGAVLRKPILKLCL